MSESSKPRKPTIHELETLLEADPMSIEILPNGEIRAVSAQWISVDEVHPPRHQRSIVRHPECGEFEATPCYGMHKPFWVPATADVFAPGKVTLPFIGTEWRPKPPPPAT